MVLNLILCYSIFHREAECVAHFSVVCPQDGLQCTRQQRIRREQGIYRVVEGIYEGCYCSYKEV